MPLSSVIGAQSIIKPGVCTSLTRPAAPFDGQVIYETDTNLLLAWNGAAWETASPTKGVIAYTSATATTAYSAATNVTVLTQAATIVPNRLYRVGGRMSWQSGTANVSFHALWISTTSSTKILWHRTYAQGSNLPATAYGETIFTAAELGVTTGTGTSVTFNLIWRDQGNAGGLNTNPDAIVGANSSPQQLYIEDIGTT